MTEQRLSLGSLVNPALLPETAPDQHEEEDDSILPNFGHLTLGGGPTVATVPAVASTVAGHGDEEDEEDEADRDQEEMMRRLAMASLTTASPPPQSSPPVPHIHHVSPPPPVPVPVAVVGAPAPASPASVAVAPVTVTPTPITAAAVVSGAASTQQPTLDASDFPSLQESQQLSREKKRPPPPPPPPQQQQQQPPQSLSSQQQQQAAATSPMIVAAEEQLRQQQQVSILTAAVQPAGSATTAVGTPGGRRDRERDKDRDRDRDGGRAKPMLSEFFPGAQRPPQSPSPPQSPPGERPRNWRRYGQDSGGGAGGAPAVDPEEVPSKVLWVGNIGPNVTPDMLHAEFSPFGEIENVKVLPQKYCAFVAFKEEKNAVTAKEEMHGQIIGGQYVRVKFRKRQDPAVTAAAVAAGQQDAGQQPQSPQQSPMSPGADQGRQQQMGFDPRNPVSRAVWVGNVGEDVTEEEFRRVASAYGVVESVKFLRPKLCAFINYMTEREAMNALSGMQGMRIGSMTVKVNFGRPLPPSRGLGSYLQQQQQQQQQFSAQPPLSPGREGVGVGVGAGGAGGLYGRYPGTAGIRGHPADPFMAAMFGRPPAAPHPSTLAFYPQGQYAHIPMPSMYPTQFVDTICHQCGVNQRTKVLLHCFHSACDECYAKLTAMGAERQDQSIYCPVCSSLVSGVLDHPGMPHFDLSPMPFATAPASFGVPYIGAFASQPSGMVQAQPLSPVSQPTTAAPEPTAATVPAQTAPEQQPPSPQQQQQPV